MAKILAYLEFLMVLLPMLQKLLEMLDDTKKKEAEKMVAQGIGDALKNIA